MIKKSRIGVNRSHSLKIILGLFAMIMMHDLAAHGGAVDAQGGHKDRKAGNYHCHREPCNKIRSTTEAATQEAISEKRPMSLLYRREDWKHWSDLDGDCMNTRHEALKAQADGSIRLSPDRCFVSSGHWIDPYSGKSFSRPSDLDIDHVVPLAWAHQRGGSRWSAEQKERFANDPVNLLVVHNRLNREKGAQPPSEWMPPSQGFRCDYLAIWTQVLAKYADLNMSASEKRIFDRQKLACQK